MLSLLAVLVLGVVLANTLMGQIRNRGIGDAAQSAELVTSFGIQPQLTGVDLRQRLAPEVVSSLDQLLRAGYTANGVETIRIWSPDFRIVYSPDHSLIGRRFPREQGVMEALRGRPSAEVRTGSDEIAYATHGSVIEAYVPLRLAPGGPPAGAFEVHLTYAPVAAAIRSDIDRLYLALAIGLLLLWATLFRIVAGASGRLRRQAAENEYQARHDLLTGLPNRSSFSERVERAIERAREREMPIGVMIVDLDRFKEVNDTLGHHSGDLLLQQAGARLEAALRSSDSLARLGGDEFAVLLTDLPEPRVAGEIATRITESLERPFTLDELTVHIEASIGIAYFPEHGDSVETLMQRADVAMYVAKAASENYETYAAQHDVNSPARLALLGELRHAIGAGEFIVHYQPKANLRNGRVEGAEALVRWQHPKRGLVPPDEFIPLAEHTGMIKPLTALVLDAALGQCRRWHEDGFELTVAVNLSVRNLLDPDLPQSIGDLLRKWELPPARLMLEITEGTIVTEQVRALDVLTRLEAMGIGLAIDDFGTGYSSLAYLKDLPVRELKIDRSFVNNMTEEGSDAFIVRSTIDLGRNLGLRVVAEGVETADAWSQLVRLGCDVAQGYYLGRPVAADELTRWLRERDCRVPFEVAFDSLEGTAAGASNPQS